MEAILLPTYQVISVKIDIIPALIIEGVQPTIAIKNTTNNPEKNTPAKMLVNMLSRGKIEVSFKESDNGEIFCQIPQRLSVSPSETAFSNGDIILYKDRMGIVCSEMKANAVKCAVIGNTHNKDLKDLFLNSPKVSLSVEWSE